MRKFRALSNLKSKSKTMEAGTIQGTGKKKPLTLSKVQSFLVRFIKLIRDE